MRLMSPTMDIVRSLLCILGMISWAQGLASTDTITSGGDNSRSGYQTNHNMDPSVVGSNGFGQLWASALTKQCINPSGPVPEQIFSQPLVYTPGSTQYVYVATTTNAIYKIDAKTGVIVTSRDVHVPFLQKDLDGCTDLQPCIGVTGTGVIDPDSNTWYFTSKTYADQTGQVTGRLNGRYYVHAVDADDLSERPGFPISLEGMIPSNNPNRMFISGNQHQRPALILTGGYIYAGFASHCVQYNFTGMLVGWDPSGNIVEFFTTEAGPEPNTVKGGGIWMSGGGVSSDDAGSLWLGTGNGYASQLHGIPVPGRQPPTALEEAAVHFQQNGDGSLAPIDFFMPFEKEQLDGADKDLGTSPLVFLPESPFSCPNVQRIGVITGKSGKTYFLNLDDLGGYQMGPNKGDEAIFVYQQENSVYSGAAVYPREGGYVYIHVVQFPTTIFKFSCDGSGNPQFTYVGATSDSNAYILGVGHGTTTSMNEDGTGLVWVSDVQGYNLRVYSIGSNSLTLIKTAQINGVTKFTRPVFGDGKVYIATTQGLLYAFGSPVNTALTCNTPYDFGTVTIAGNGTTGQNSTGGNSTGIIQCKANITTTVNTINVASVNFQINKLPKLPLTLQAGQNLSFQASFVPQSPGPLAADILINTTNSVALFTNTTRATVKGIGNSLTPILAVTPNTVTFQGVITGMNPGGVDQSIIFANQGSSTLHITEIDYSTVSETGPWVTPNKTSGPNGTAAGIGPFTFENVPTTIAPESQVVIDINFLPPNSSNYAVYVQVVTDGGTKLFTVVATSVIEPVALLEFQSIDGDSWVSYSNSTPFTFGDVLEQITLNRVMRLSNTGGPTAGRLSVTVSKPPIVAGQIVGARNNVDLGEGTSVLPGQPQNATLFCSVPKTQVNTPAYNATAVWTMNTGDPNFGKRDIQFYCHAISEQVGPLLGNGSAQYGYIGCYKENNPGRQLATELYGSDTTTIGQCLKDCNAAGWILAGLQYNRECWCGNTLPVLEVDDANCNFPCSGNQSQICGGNGIYYDGAYISLFADSTRFNQSANVTSTTSSAVSTPTGGPYIDQGIGAFGYIGCYNEPKTGGRALTTDGPMTSNLTIAMCLKACAGYTYAGAEYSRECYCANSIATGSSKGLDSSCDMPCAGNSSEYCGAGDFLSMYSTISNTTSNSTTASSSTTSSSVSSSSTSSLVSTSTGPAIVKSYGKYVYNGCWTEATGIRALSKSSFANNSMTVESCGAYCSAVGGNGTLYFGVEYSRECYCGSTFNTGSVKTADSDCSMACMGNSNEFCGAGNRLTTYVFVNSTLSSTSLTTASSTSASPTATGPIIPTGNANFAFVSCNLEVPGRALTAKSYSNSSNTVPQCLSFCTGYAYAAVEYAAECYCGNILNSQAVVKNNSDCNMLCIGDSTKNSYCGGSDRIQVYQNISITSTSALASISATSTSATSTSSATSSASSSSSSSSASAGPTNVPNALGFSYNSCIVDIQGRTLVGNTFANDSMTVEACLSFCAGYTYAGVEYRRECYCSNVIKTGGTVSPGTDCSLACGGNANELCGGYSRISLYQATSGQSGGSKHKRGPHKIKHSHGMKHAKKHAKN